MSYRRAGADTGDMSKDTLFASDAPPAAPKRTGIFQSCAWFKESPLRRWTFAVMLLFAIMTPLWLILKATSGTVGDVLAGVCGIILACYAANHFRILLGLKEQVNIKQYMTIHFILCYILLYHAQIIYYTYIHIYK